MKKISKKEYSPAEQRAARAERVQVFEAEPYGWTARSHENEVRDYHLFCEPYSRKLACTCADFVYRGNAEPGFECKHVSAVLKFIGKQYLERHYDGKKTLLPFPQPNVLALEQN